MKHIRHSAVALLVGTAVLMLTACTSQNIPAAPNPLPTVTKTVTTQPKPAPTVTVTASANPGTVPASAAQQLLPTDDDIANIAYRSGMPADTQIQFTVPATGYEILYICYNSKLGTEDGAAGYKDQNEGGSRNSGFLTCDSKIHTLTADAAYVKKVGAVGKLTKLAITGDRMFVLGVDLSVRPL